MLDLKKQNKNKTQHLELEFLNIFFLLFFMKTRNGNRRSDIY